jgi:hypothetical protein
MNRFSNISISTPGAAFEERLKRTEQKLNFLTNTLSAYFVTGRLRSDRTAPASSNDVLPLDALNDVVRDANYMYILINDAGALKWRRIAMSSF